jgi:toxin-antitoxin system PIN domain toxin
VILADVHVLIYAFRQDSPHHAVCKSWLDAVVLGDARFGVSPMTLSAVVRIVTNPHAFVPPSSIEEAFAFCDNLLNQSHCEIVEPGDRHWEIFRRMCLEARIQGPKATDAWFAALAIEQGCVWITYDRDYARFPGLEWREPSSSLP